VLHRAAAVASTQGLPVLPVYVLDPRNFNRTRHGTLKTGPIRALFLLQSILALKRRLRQLGSDLLIKIGHPEEVLPPLLPKGSVVLTQEEVTSEELRLDSRLRAALTGSKNKEGADVQWEYCWGTTLFHREDLPFKSDLSDMPDVYTRFKNTVEPELACKANEVPPSFNGLPKQDTQIKVRPCFPDPELGSLPLPSIDDAMLNFEPAWSDLPYTEDVPEPPPHPGSVLEFRGGEDAGLERLRYYMRDTDLVATYFDTRNEMLGGDCSTKFAPWLANGCLSPRKVFEQLREHEMRCCAGRSTYWVMFALGARDFYRFFGAKHGDAVFREEGIICKKQAWRGGDREFTLWAEGRTGYPFIDANMRELKETGFMSNRGRQNVASFLALDLHVDWRRGADWFESRLVDYDVTANWCNWVFAAGLAGGRLNRFNILRQGKSYDPDGAYVRHWVPELRELPSNLIHEPWLVPADDKTMYAMFQDYPPPCVDPSSFNSSTGPTPIQLKLRGQGPGAGPPRGAGRGRGRKSGGSNSQQLNAVAPDEATAGDAVGAGGNQRRWRPGRSKPCDSTTACSFTGPDWLVS